MATKLPQTMPPIVRLVSGRIERKHGTRLYAEVAGRYDHDIRGPAWKLERIERLSRLELIALRRAVQRIQMGDKRPWLTQPTADGLNDLA